MTLVAPGTGKESTMAERKVVGYLEAVVRVPLYEGEQFGPGGPGVWWEYCQPGVTSEGEVGLFNFPLIEVSRRLLDDSWNP